MTDLAPAFRGEDVRGLELEFRLHASLARGGYVYEYAARDFPELVITHTRETRRSPEVRRARVGDLSIPWGDWDLAADTIHFFRGRPDDADEPFFDTTTATGEPS